MIGFIIAATAFVVGLNMIIYEIDKNRQRITNIEEHLGIGEKK